MKALFPGTAEFSPCDAYRWRLTRDLRIGSTRKAYRPFVSIGLNPSTATAEEDDRTIRKEQLYAQLWGYDFYIKTNAYGFRTKKPKIMFAAQKRGVDIVGADNDAAILRAVREVRNHAGILFAAWGGNIEPARQAAIADLVGDTPIWCIKRNDDGTAMHPLYATNLAKPIPWSCP